MIEPDEKLMRTVIAEAEQSRQDYPIGAAVVRDGEVIALGTNRARIEQDSTQHAEMVVIRDASKKLGSRYLTSCVLYTTHEPCPMCAAAAVWARMDGIVFGSTLQDMIDYKKASATRGQTWRTIDISAIEILEKGDPKLEIAGPFLREECLKLFRPIDQLV